MLHFTQLSWANDFSYLDIPHSDFPVGDLADDGHIEEVYDDGYYLEERAYGLPVETTILGLDFLFPLGLLCFF